MKSRTAVFAVLASVFLVAGSLVAWAVTGRETFTRWPNARLEASDAPISKSEEDLLGEIGIDAAPSSEAATIESRFAFGLLPSGADPRHLLSVATTCLAAATVPGAVVLHARWRRGTEQRGTEPRASSAADRR
ncbi:MAG: hypothetical protein ACKO3W_15160 [bacterium]